MHVIYDVSHNIAKVEQHVVDGKERTLLVHRKGSTRAFPPHHPLIAVDYQVSLAVGKRNEMRILDESGSFRVLNRDLNAMNSLFELMTPEASWSVLRECEPGLFFC